MVGIYAGGAGRLAASNQYYEWQQPHVSCRGHCNQRSEYLQQCRNGTSWILATRSVLGGDGRKGRAPTCSQTFS